MKKNSNMDNKSNHKQPSSFTRFSNWASCMAGKSVAFFLACAVIVVWGLTGPLFHYSDTWQLVINTGTTIITFLMVFIIQNTQNREIRATQLKLDEIIRALKGAQNIFMDLEERDEEELLKIQKRYSKMAQAARETLENGEDLVQTIEESNAT